MLQFRSRFGSRASYAGLNSRASRRAMKSHFSRAVSSIKKTTVGTAGFAGDLLRRTIAFRRLYMVRLTISQHRPVVRYHGCTVQSEHYAAGRIVREEELGNPLG